MKTLVISKKNVFYTTTLALTTVLDLKQLGSQFQIWFKVRTMTKPTIVQRKDIKPEKDITGLETPAKSQEISVVICDANLPKKRCESSKI